MKKARSKKQQREPAAGVPDVLFVAVSHEELARAFRRGALRGKGRRPLRLHATRKRAASRWPAPRCT